MRKIKTKRTAHLKQDKTQILNEEKATDLTVNDKKKEQETSEKKRETQKKIDRKKHKSIKLKHTN